MPKFYTHKVELIERTKLLEGVLCQSLSFTNTRGNDYLKTSSYVPPEFSNFSTTFPNGSGLPPYFPINDVYKFKTPIHIEATLPSLAEVGETLRAFAQSEMGAPYINAYRVTSQRDSSMQIVSSIVINGRTVFSASNYADLTQQIPYVFTESMNTIQYTVIAILKENENAAPDTASILAYYFTITYQNVVAIENKYPLKPNTITSAVNRILDLAEPLYLSEAPRFTFNPVQAEKWKDTTIPDTTITQATLREQLQHIANYVHAQARLGGWYNGEYQENMVFFDEYGQEEESTLQGKPYVANQIKHSINDYCTQIDTNAQNIVNSLDYGDGVVLSPDAENFKTVRTENINARLSESNCIIETELPIYEVTSLKVKAYNSDGTVVTVDDKSEWEIEPFVFEQHAYNNLSSYGGNYPYSKEYALYYKQGQKNISGLFFKATKLEGTIFGEYLVSYTIANILDSVAKRGTDDWKNYVTNNFPYLAFQVSYIPFYETKYSHTKGYMIGQERKLPYTQIYNQTENVIETRFYGENIKGVAKRLGNQNATRTYYLSSINDVAKVGTMLDGYNISSAVTEYLPQSIRCTVGLTKKFNRLSQNVGINSTKRVYEVSEKQAYDRNILLKEYICIGDNTSLPLKPSRVQKNVKSTMQMLLGATENQEKLLAVAQLEFLNSNLSSLAEIKAPLVSSAFGNVMTYSWEMKDNYSAGTKIENLGNGFWQTDVSYGNYYGKAYYLLFQLLDTIASDNNLQGAMTSETEFEFSYDASPSPIYSRPYLVRKDSREILKFNLAIEYISNRQDLILGSNLASCNPCVSNSKKDAQGNIIQPVLYVLNRKINTYESKINLSDVVGNYNVFQLAGADGISFALPNNIEFESWAIAYEPTSETMTVYNEDTSENEEITIAKGGEILIACNKGSDYYSQNGYSEYIYVKSYSDKLKEYEGA